MAGKIYRVAVLATHLRENRTKSITRRCIVARKYKDNQLEKIYEAVGENQGKRPGFIARILGKPRSHVTRALPAMQEHGYLVSEDEKGGLWIFRKRK